MNATMKVTKIEKINKLNNQQKESNLNYAKQQPTDNFSEILQESINEIREENKENKYDT